MSTYAGAPSTENPTGPSPGTQEGKEDSTATTPHTTKPAKQKQADAPPPPTHFLALPLVTPHSLPQLARSTAHFQAVTTAPRPLRPSEIQAREWARQAETPERDAGAEGGVADRDSVGDGDGEELKIIPAQAHRAPGTLHLTLGTMVLKTPEELRRALEVLREVDYGTLLRDARRHVGLPEAAQRGQQNSDAQVQQAEKTSAAVMDAGEEVAGSLMTLTRPVSPPATTQKDGPKHQGIKVDLRGLGTFPSPKKARVFYAAPRDEEGKLQMFAEAVQRHFIEEGIVRREGRPLTLHATVANLKYVKTGKQWGRGGKGRSGGGGGREGREIDARKVIEAFGESGNRGLGHGMGDDSGAGAFVWAEGVDIDRARICKMGAVKSDDPVMGMEYPAIRIPVDGEEGEGDLAEVTFT